jgi:hypothetical protein
MKATYASTQSSNDARSVSLVGPRSAMVKQWETADGTVAVGEHCTQEEQVVWRADEQEPAPISAKRPPRVEKPPPTR